MAHKTYILQELIYHNNNNIAVSVNRNRPPTAPCQEKIHAPSHLNHLIRATFMQSVSNVITVSILTQYADLWRLLDGNAPCAVHHGKNNLPFIGYHLRQVRKFRPPPVETPDVLCSAPFWLPVRDPAPDGGRHQDFNGPRRSLGLDAVRRSYPVNR